MKLIWRFALAGVSLLAMTAYASAEPISISIGFALWAGPLGTIFSSLTPIAFANIFTAVATAAVSIGVSLATRPRAGPRADPSALKSSFQVSESSEIRAIGRVRVGGNIFYGNTAGFTRYRLIGHVKGPIDAVEEYYLGGRSVTVEADGAVSSPPWSKPDGSWVYILTKRGDGTETSWTQLMAAFPDIWTSAHRVRGIAQSLVMYISPGINSDLFGKLYQGGEPALEEVQRVALVYDPRLDSLNGGSGSQRADDEDTWTWTDNGILGAAHIMRSYPDLTSDDFDWADIILEADKADVPVDTKAGSERRSRISGFWQSESSRGDTMADVLLSTGTEITQNAEGKIRIRLIDDARQPEFTFTDRHLIDFSLKAGPDGVERPNVCRVSYYSPERNYEMADIDLSGIAWARIDEEVERYGEKVYDVVLPFCPSASQAQRIARRLFALARADTGIIKTNMFGMRAMVNDVRVVDIEYPDLDETATCLIAPPKVDDTTGTVEIPFVEQPVLSEWNPATDEADAPEQIPELAFNAVMPKPVPVRALIVTYSDGTTNEVRFDYTPLPADTAITEATYRLYSGGTAGGWSAMTEVRYDDGGSPAELLDYAWATAGEEDQTADFRVRVFNSDSEGSYWGPDNDGLQVSLEYDNTTPEEPVVSLGGGTVTGHELHVAYFKARYRVKYTPAPYGPYIDVLTSDIRPGQAVPITWPDPSPLPDFGDFVEKEIVAYTSDGTAGPAWTLETELTP